MSKRQPGNRATLKTVAEKAGVSVATVSLILSGKEEWLKQFHAETISRVRQCAKRLGYRANLFATGLPMKTSSFFTLVLEDFGSRNASAWPYWAFEGSLLAGVVRAATTQRLYPVVTAAHSHSEDEAGIQQISRIMNGGVFGSIVRTPNPPLEKFLRTRIRQGHPVVVVFPSRLPAWPTNAMDVDNSEVGRLAGRVLLQRGRRHWAVVRCLVPSGAHSIREEAFCTFARQTGASVQTVTVTRGADEITTAEEIAEQIRSKVDGVFGLDALSTVGSVMMCLNSGRHPGQDVDVLGCDCAAYHGRKLPAITSIDISWREVGGLAVRKLVEITEQQTSTFETVLLSPRIQAGETCPLPLDIELPGDPANATLNASPQPNRLAAK